MLPLRERQRAFAAALTDPELPVPTGVLGRNGRCDVRRFAVYRNNVTAGLVTALGDRFPVVRRLVGDPFFAAMARAYVAGHKPASPLLIEYGSSFPDFIAAFPPAAEVPYLADVARLEAAWTEAFHAAEASPLDPRAVPVEDLEETVLKLHPSLRLIRSPYPIGTIWAAHQGEAEPQPPAAWEPEELLVVRPDAEVLVHRLPAGGVAFAADLAAGVPLGAATAAACAAVPGFDLPYNLSGLFRSGAVIGFTRQEARP